MTVLPHQNIYSTRNLYRIVASPKYLAKLWPFRLIQRHWYDVTVCLKKKACNHRMYCKQKLS